VPDADALLAAYDEQMRERVPAHPPAGVRYEWDGPLLRVVGQHRGFVSTPRDVGLRGSELDELIARQRDYFAARGEAFEWKTRGHDLPPDLTDRLRAAGFVPEDDETVLIGLAGELAAEPALPAGVTLRGLRGLADVRGRDGVRRAVGRLDAPRLAWPGHLPGAGRPPRATGGRARRDVPAGRRVCRQQPHPAAPRAPGGDDHDPVRLGAYGRSSTLIARRSSIAA
jgi:hypothetical protein